MADKSHMRLALPLARVIQIHVMVQIKIHGNTRNVPIQTNRYDMVYKLHHKRTTTGKAIRDEITAIYTSYMDA